MALFAGRRDDPLRHGSRRRRCRGRNHPRRDRADARQPGRVRRRRRGSSSICRRQLPRPPRSAMWPRVPSSRPWPPRHRRRPHPPSRRRRLPIRCRPLPRPRRKHRRRRSRPTSKSPMSSSRRSRRLRPSRRHRRKRRPAPTSGSAAPVETAEPTDSAAARGRSARMISRWQRSMLGRLETAKRGMHTGGQTGSVLVAFSIASDGAVVDCRVMHGSGSPRLDAAALALVRRAAPFPRPPAGLTGPDLSFKVPVVFARRSAETP